MSDIESVGLLWVKFVLFLVLGTLAVTTALLLYPDFRLACLIAMAVWASSRAYYFAFYVIEHYVDPEFRFSGLSDFVRYALQRKTLDRSRMKP